MHRKAVQIVHELGPAAIRPLSSALFNALEDPDWQNNTYALRSLYWSIPESSRSIAMLMRWLSNPLHGHLFGSIDCEELYPKLPQTMPLLVSCLRNPYLAREAAIGLGMMGSNALSAVPALVEVSDRGVAEPPLRPNFTITYGSPGEPFVLNRCDALQALGKIGAASREVLAVINRGLVETNEAIRFAAMSSLAALHQPIENRLADLVNTFSIRRSIKIKQLVDWVGTLGNSGRKALPWLRQFVTSQDVQNLPEGVHANLGDFVIAPDEFRRAAIVAICRIDPEETRQYLPDLLAGVGRSWDTVELLMGSKLLAAEIVRALEPMMQETNAVRPALAASAILALKPDHDQALSTLRYCIAHGQLNERLIAAGWLWKRKREAGVVLPLCIEGLAAAESQIGQIAASILADMGPEARPAIPALKAALWHSDRYVRERAGKALRKIAPEEMPSIQ